MFNYSLGVGAGVEGVFVVFLDFLTKLGFAYLAVGVVKLIDVVELCIKVGFAQF